MILHANRASGPGHVHLTSTMIQFFLPSRLTTRPTAGLLRTLNSTMLPGPMSPTLGVSDACVDVSSGDSCRVLHSTKAVSMSSQAGIGSLVYVRVECSTRQGMGRGRFAPSNDRRWLLAEAAAEQLLLPAGCWCSGLRLVNVQPSAAAMASEHNAV